MGRGVAAWIGLAGGRLYNAETGFLGHWEDQEDGTRKSVGRRGGTRSTPGTPDFPVVMMREPFPFTMSVELKGSSTAIKPKDWQYCLDAATYGHPHLLVRSAEEFLTGLRYLGLLPDRLRQVHPVDWNQWPQNINYLDMTITRSGPWGAHASARALADPCHFWSDPERLEQVKAKRPKPPHPLALMPR